MSRIGSSSGTGASGVRVATEPLSNVYTVLLLIGAVLLAATMIALWITVDSRYGVSFAVTEAGKAALNAPEQKTTELQAQQAEMDKWTAEATTQELTAPAGGATPPPATETPAPAAETPAPATTPAEPAPATPAPAAPTTPAPSGS